MDIYHNSHDNNYRTPFGAAEISTEVKVAIDVLNSEGEFIEDINVSLRLWHDKYGEKVIKMDRNGNRYETSITMPDEGCLLWYYFIVNKANEETLYYGNNYNNTGGEGCVYDGEPPSYQITVYKSAPVPDWYKNGIVYQIFPDRFARDENWKLRCQTEIDASKSRAGQGRFIEEDWYRPAYYIKNQEGKVTDWPFYGGSLKGIEEKLDYLTSLGVTAIYLNPIFKATSNHRYDTADYLKIDPMLGTEEDFKSLAKSARQKGIRLILDGVFSHVGADSIYFDKYGNYGGGGAFNNSDSEYRDWFEFRDDDQVGYRSWWGVEDLPEVNESNASFRNLICGPKGTLVKWLEAGASGWRLDVADELPDSFIKDIRKTIKGVDEDNLLLGEVWEDASNKISYGEKREYLMGDELDSTMNYPVRDLLLDFICYKKSASETNEKIMSLAENYPYENFYGALNLIGSHDRERILTVMGADENYDRAAAKVKLSSVLQFGLPGVPCIYYGDEAGMMGGADPENRSGFIWQRENPDTEIHYRELSVIYDEHPVLKSGEFRPFNVDNEDILAFTRTCPSEQLLILANRSDKLVSISRNKFKTLRIPYALELLESKELEVNNGKFVNSIEIPAFSARVICIRAKAPKHIKMERGAGVICHISSIPGGKLGKSARAFVDYLASAGMSYWQILPLNPAGIGNSPYSSNAALAGDARFIDENELPDLDGFEEFCEANNYWLDDYAHYVSYREKGNVSDSDLIKSVKREQYYFATEWQEIKEYANSEGIKIIGDLPIFVCKDSADVMADSSQFQIDENGNLKCHAGVPPDYFAPEGQDWGNPLYNWPRMKEEHYKWWKNRLKQCFERYDYVRLDHFRSFSEYYAIPEGKTPVEGKWQHGPGIEFFRKMASDLSENGELRIIAEDLGQLDIGVYNLLKLSGLPGMNIWQFSADEMMAMSPEAMMQRVFYTGTHDNQTLLGWCQDRGMDIKDAMGIIRKLYESKSPVVIMQMQDMFLLDDSARMNVPGVAEGNWNWRIPGNSVQEAYEHADRIATGFRSLAAETGRLPANNMEDFLKEYGIHTNESYLGVLVNEMCAYYESAIDGSQIIGIEANPQNMEDASQDYKMSNQEVIAVDMGGTNLRVARVTFGDKPVIGKLIKIATPGRDGKITVDELFAKIAENVALVDKEQTCNDIGFSFSFPGTPTSDGDMLIELWDKELEIAGGEGMPVGQLLNNALESLGQKRRTVTVVNDTVATYLSGTLEANNCIAGFVLGTGANICFHSNVTNLIYNLEAGNYPYLPAGELDKSLDSKSADPGFHLAEKMMSGAYIYDLIELASEEAFKTNLITDDQDSVQNKLALEGIERGCLDRAAAYSAVLIASAIRMSGNTRDCCQIIVEGSTFWKTLGFKDVVKEYLNTIIDSKDIEVEFIKMDDSSLLGAAAAGNYESVGARLRHLGFERS